MKKHELLTIVLFCGFLLSMTLGFFLLPKSEFSVNEKRFLAEAPDINWDNISSGDWGNDIESYLADHIPGRDFFVGLNAYFERDDNKKYILHFRETLVCTPTIKFDGVDMKLDAYTLIGFKKSVRLGALEKEMIAQVRERIEQ